MTAWARQLPTHLRVWGRQLSTRLFGHWYVSTGCLHGRHEYCRCDTGMTGPKVAGRCKFCPALCRCACHRATR